MSCAFYSYLGEEPEKSLPTKIGKENRQKEKELRVVGERGSKKPPGRKSPQ